VREGKTLSSRDILAPGNPWSIFAKKEITLKWIGKETWRLQVAEFQWLSGI
jgi:hypothetical protein